MRLAGECKRGRTLHCEGSGIGGMILGADLGADLASDREAPESRISGVREKIARRMRESLAGTAQYTLNTSADAGGLLSLRARIKASSRGRTSTLTT